MIKKIASLTACIFILLLWAGGNTYLPASTITNGSNEIHANDSIMTAKELYDAFKKDEAAAKNNIVEKQSR